jgi:hypothetical protein
MQGNRRPDKTEAHTLQPGEYVREAEGWSICDPLGNIGGIDSRWSITEHDDGTITVSPSIRQRGTYGEWHGYLERGVWREC